MGLHDHPRGLSPGDEIDYVQRVTDLSVTATTAAGAQAFIDGNAIVFDGATRIRMEFYAALADSTQALTVDFWDGSTDLTRVYQSNALTVGIYAAQFLTPTAGSHTYHVKAWRGTGSANIYGTLGGAVMPAWYRITKA